MTAIRLHDRAARSQRGRLKSDCGDNPNPNHHLLDPLREWLDGNQARELTLGPSLVILGSRLGHIPARCHVNPFCSLWMATISPD